jgi:hypothetical protein
MPLSRTVAPYSSAHRRPPAADPWAQAASTAFHTSYQSDLGVLITHQLALPEREMAGRWWQGPDSESDCCCSMDAFELEVSGAVTGREAIDGLA